MGEIENVRLSPIMELIRPLLPSNRLKGSDVSTKPLSIVLQSILRGQVQELEQVQEHQQMHREPVHCTQQW